MLVVALLYLLFGAKPAVEITSPASGTTTFDAQILVAGRATGIQTEAVTLEVNGSPQTVPVFNGSFEAQVSLVLGANAIRASVNDISSEPRKIIRRPQPVIRISSPPENARRTTRAEIDVIGTVENSDDRAVTLDVNGTAHEVPVTNSQFSTTRPLVVGRNVIRALVTGASPAAIEVFRVETGIAITYPPNGYTTDRETVTVSGTVENSEAGMITLKSNEFSRNVPVQNGRFTSEIVLNVGENRIRASLGDGSSDEIVVHRILPPVIITLTSPQSGSTQSAFASVRGTVQNARGRTITLRVNGSSLAVLMTGSGFAAEVRLEIGNNVIQASQDDAVSNEVVVNRVPPPPVVIQIRSPQSGSTQDSSARVTGTINNPQGPTVTLTVNGSGPTLPITNGTFTADVKLAIGENRIRASQGEAVSNEVVISWFKPKTLIEIRSPQSGSTQDLSTRVSGTITNPQGPTITLTVNGSGPTLQIRNGSFTADVTLHLGENHIQASQGEAVSNEVVVNLLKPKTLIEITSPRSSKTQRSSVTVTGTITNPSSQTITLTVNGLDRKVTTTNDRFEKDVNLEVGENRIRASQNDSLSNEVIVVRQPPPSIKIISPAGGSARQSVVTVTGRVENAQDATIRFTVNGSSRSVRITDRGFTAEATLIPGENLIEASVKGASDRITLVRPKIIDTPKVRIIIDTPKNGEITQRRVLAVNGRVENVEAETITLTVNGKASQVQTALGVFRSRVGLSPGKNSIRASFGSASDEVTVTLEVQDVPPDKTPDKPPDKTPDKTPDKPPESADDCGKINCDCKNVKASLSIAGTASAGSVASNSRPSPFSASSTGSQSQRPPQDRQTQCRNAEHSLKKDCGATGKVEGFCPPNASGPKAWPKRTEKKNAGFGVLKKVFGKEKQGGNKQ